jgi:hypothetical protein
LFISNSPSKRIKSTHTPDSVESADFGDGSTDTCQSRGALSIASRVLAAAR